MARTNMERKGDCGKRTKELIARYYLALAGEFRDQDNKLVMSMGKDDMFHNAITLILQDSKFKSYTSDEEIMLNIRRRIKNVICEISKDDKSQQQKLYNYADNLQAYQDDKDV